MSMLNATTLIEAVKRTVSTPQNQARLNDDDILAFANEEIAVTILPEIHRLREDYLIYTDQEEITQGQAFYQIPRRAVGRTIRDLCFFPNVNSTENRRLPLLNNEDIPNYSTPGTPVGYVIQNDKIRLLPVPGTSAGKIEITYEMAPSTIVATDQTYQITAIVPSTGTITLGSAIPGDVLSSQLWDFVSYQSANIVMGHDLEATSFSSSTIIFDPDDLPEDLVVGDYVCKATESPYIALPLETHPVVVSATCCRVLEAIGDFEAATYRRGELNTRLMAMRAMLTPRIIGQNHKIGLSPLITSARRFLIRRM